MYILTDINIATIIKETKAFRIKEAMKRPLWTMKGLSVFIILLWYIDSIIGARQDAAKRQTAT